MKKAKKVKRIVLGVGHPWYFGSGTDGKHGFASVQLTQKPVAASILLRGGETVVSLNNRSTGNWNKVRLVLEVLA